MLFGALGEVALGEGESDSLTKAPISIASAEAFGTPVILADALSVLPASIASAEAFGSPSLVYIIAPSSIASSETFGSLTVFELMTYEPLSRL